MVQFIFFVDGLKESKDESAVFETAREIFKHSEIKVNTVTSSLTIMVAQSECPEESTELLKSALQELGYSLKLPPNRVEVLETEASSAPCATAARTKCDRKKKRRVPWGVFIASVCATLILAVLATYAVATTQFEQKIKDIQQAIWDSQETDEPGDEAASSPESAFPELEIFKFLFDQYAIEEIDDEALMEAVLKAYATGTGDIYAEYYTAEEFEAMMAENQGDMEGIGVSVTNDRIEIGGLSYQVLTVISVFNDSPALKAGVRVGDHIYTVTDANGEVRTVEELGYDNSIACVRGSAGTDAEFSVVRFSSTGNYETISFKITRAPFIAETVMARVLAEDPDIGVIKISQFDLTTPTQFSRSMDTLIAQGCTKFIFDVRYNPGGMLASIEAVLSTLLLEGDVMISTVYKDGTQETDRVKVVKYAEEYSSCSVSKNDIGKYRGYEFAVLTNEYTASAAELFAANIRDHKLGTLVGVTTYGKGCMQTIFDLSYFDLEGALKLTTAWYQPPCGENYHDVGIDPDIPIETDESVLEEYGNIYLIPDERDPQMQAAIKALNQ